MITREDLLGARDILLGVFIVFVISASVYEVIIGQSPLAIFYMALLVVVLWARISLFYFKREMREHCRQEAELAARRQAYEQTLEKTREH